MGGIFGWYWYYYKRPASLHMTVRGDRALNLRRTPRKDQAGVYRLRPYNLYDDNDSTSSASSGRPEGVQRTWHAQFARQMTERTMTSGRAGPYYRAPLDPRRRCQAPRDYTRAILNSVTLANGPQRQRMNGNHRGSSSGGCSCGC